MIFSQRMFTFLFKIMSILTSVTAFASPSLSSCDSVAIFGCGVLGTSLCKQILSCPDFQSKSGESIGMKECMKDIVL